MGPQRTRSIDADFSEWAVLSRLGVEAEPVRVARRYELRQRIGRGGYGTVYEAFDRDLERRVAIKVMALGDPTAAQREGQMLAKLEHHNVVRIFDHGIGDDYRYVVLQLLEGPTLREWCRAKSPSEIIAAFAQAGEGLAAAHAAGLVHRDFKPSNVRIGPRDEAVVVDFGLARRQDTLELESGDERRYLAGTLAYVAPERLTGSPGDARADQFSFCVALWECLARENPFGPAPESMTAAERIQAIARGVRSTRGITGLGRHQVAAIKRGLQYRPNRRWPSMAALLHALQPRARQGWGELAAASSLVAAGLGLVGLALVPPPPPGPSTSAWAVEQYKALTLSPRVLEAAAAGRGEQALRELELVTQSDLDPARARRLAMTAQAVARVFEDQLDYESAVIAWALSVRLAKTAGDRDLEQLGHDRLYEAAGSITATRR